jgi:hypothetical protein
LKVLLVGKEDNSQEGSPFNGVGTPTLNPSAIAGQKVDEAEMVVRPGESDVELVLEGGVCRVE